MNKYHFAFDLDGTITKHEVLPLIARELNIEEEMAELTRKNLNGDIPYNQGFTMRVNMLKSVPIKRVQEIINAVELSDPIVQFLTDNRSRCYVVTANLDVWIKLLINKLDIRCISSTANYRNNRLLGIKNIINKEIVHTHTTNPIVAIGDGNNDYEMLNQAPISIAYGGVHAPAPSLLSIADYAIYNDKELCSFLKQLL